jgi:HAD superfamily hydrolase (TIGR01509 family)
MRHLNIMDGIDGIISGDDVTQPKPNPECFLLAMEREGVTPRETIIFEDSAMGLEAAKRSGAAYVKIIL